MTIKITTPAGRTLRLEHETARTLEAVGVSPSQIDLDIDQLVSGGPLTGLLSACQAGAENNNDDWLDYVNECWRLADKEMAAKQAPKETDHGTDR